MNPVGGRTIRTGSAGGCPGSTTTKGSTASSRGTLSRHHAEPLREPTSVEISSGKKTIRPSAFMKTAVAPSLEIADK